MLTIQNVTKRFGGITALNALSFTLEQGKITAIVGPNGAGKTTLFDVVSGLVPADSGEILWQGTNIASWRPDQISQAGIARSWQQVRLFKNLTILDHLVLAERTDDTGLLRNIIRRLDIQPAHYENFFAPYSVARPLGTLVSELSYGQRKLLQLAMIMIRPHQLLLLDEPVAGVNKVIQQKIEALLLDFKAKGETIAIIEHDMEFVRKLADKVVVMDEGKVLAEGEPNIVLQDKRVLEAYLGE